MNAVTSIRTILATAALFAAGTALANQTVDRLDPGTEATAAGGNATLVATSPSPSSGEQFLTEFDETTQRNGVNHPRRSASGLATDEEMWLEKHNALLHRFERARRQEPGASSE